MCVIATILKGSKIPPFHVLHQMWESNPDGAGFMYPAKTEDGRPTIRIIKQLMSFSSLKRKLTEHAPYFMDANNIALCDFAIHFRIASAGGAAPHLTHPFHTGEATAIMHNGHIASLAYESKAFDDCAGKAKEKAVVKVTDTKGAITVFKREPAKGKISYMAPIDRREKRKWIKSVMNRNGCTFKEAESIVDTYLEVEEKASRIDTRSTPTTVTTTNGAADPAATATPEQTTATASPPAIIVPVAPVLAESDTSRLATILSRLPKGWQRNDVCHYFISETFLRSDRLLIFDHNGLAKIIGEKSGEWIDGMWVSNTYWRTKLRVSGAALNNPAGSAYQGGYQNYGWNGYGSEGDGYADYYRRSHHAKPEQQFLPATYQKGLKDVEATDPTPVNQPSLPPGEATETEPELLTPPSPDVPLDPHYRDFDE